MHMRQKIIKEKDKMINKTNKSTLFSLFSSKNSSNLKETTTIKITRTVDII